MIETFKEFTFEAKRSLPPHEQFQRHVFRLCLYVKGDPDPVYGWPIALQDVERAATGLIDRLRRGHLNDIEGLALPSNENMARWIWAELSPALPGLTRIQLTRGAVGERDGCIYTERG